MSTHKTHTVTQKAAQCISHHLRHVPCFTRKGHNVHSSTWSSWSWTFASSLLPLSGWIRSPAWYQMSLTCWGTWPSWTWGIIGWRTWMPPSSPGWRFFTARGTASPASGPRAAYWKASTPPTMVGFWHVGLHVFGVGNHVLLGRSLITHDHMNRSPPLSH